MHPLYVLTPMTGREAGANRTVVVSGVEMKWSLAVVLIVAVPVSAFVALIGWMIVGQYAILAIPVVEIGAVWLFYMRSRNGLGQTNVKRLADHRRARDPRQLYLCDQPVEPTVNTLTMVIPNEVPYGGHPALASDAENDATPAPRPVHAAGAVGEVMQPWPVAAPAAPAAPAVSAAQSAGALNNIFGGVA